jgi:mono/diheme cytochrome c family protein
MKNMLVVTLGIVTMILSTATLAGSREDLLTQYAATAKATSFSAARGQSLHTQNFSGGKPETPSCTTCHGKDTRQSGRALTGKTIEPVAVSVTPTRYTDPAKVEKWFKRNCTEVLGRECTPQEKGDWLTFVIDQ